MERWIGKVALVTGASSGIGRAIAFSLAEHGIIVLAVARRESKLKELEDSAKGLKGEIHIKVADVTKEEDVIATVQFADKQLGGLHVLVNNAGTSYCTKVLDCNLEHWRTMFDLNVFGLGMCTREAVACMKRSNIDDGHIINISQGLPTGTGKHIYCATKHAVRLISAGIRAELNEQKSGIKITAICPGVVSTEIFNVGGWQLPADLPALEDKDIAAAVVSALATPPNVLDNTADARKRTFKFYLSLPGSDTSRTKYGFKCTFILSYFLPAEFNWRHTFMNNFV
ncbi:farnesol dehydrogenase-like isoform X2 [Rhodnius prolixus]|uniref:farnesol dehydrogenase-like isoform X2 n=1 Tax=Rhodnius prolixus TaxID=13249 RepID=UPI003D18E54D